MKWLLPLVSLVLPAIVFPQGAKGASAEDAAALIERYALREAATPSSEHPSWRRPEKIAVWTNDRERIAWLSAAAPDVELVMVGPSTLGTELTDVDGLVGTCNPNLLRPAEALRWIQVFSAGVESCVALPQLKERSIVLTNMQRVKGPTIAEHVIAMMMSLTRQLPHYGALQADNVWRRGGIPEARHWEVEGKTMLVVGLGGIGTEVARKANALGMRVVATRNSSTSGPGFVDRVELASELPTLVADAHVIVNSTPLTPSTRNLFDRELFSQMRQGTLFINVGRGKSVVTADLVTALESGQLGGAGLDVTEPEPLPPTSPLWQLPNVIITPHMSAQSDKGNERSWVIIRENLRRYAAGERMLNLVDLDRGY